MIMRLLIAIMCLAGFSSLSCAKDMGMKDALNGEMKSEEDAMKAEKGEMRGETEATEDAMKEKKGKMKDETEAKEDGAKKQLERMMDETELEMRGFMY